MRVKTVDAVSMVDIFKTLNEFIPEVTLDFTEEGLKISGIDASKVVLINVFLPKSYFDEYDVNGEEKVGVNLEDLADLLSGVTKNDSLTFSGEGSMLTIEIEGEYYRKFAIPMLQVESVELPQTDLEFPFRAKLITPTFTEIISGFEDLGADAVRFKSNGGKLTLTAYSDVVESTIELSTDNGGLLEAEGSDAESVYGLEYLANTTRLKRASGSMEIRFGTQLPLKLRYEMPQGGYNDFYIAPRAE
ncbi:MAG: DNA polymerase sliding clamp [Sulfolobus sp.]|nr:DNA polymerase sliding clamp [Sulfolobus sp.]